MSEMDKSITSAIKAHLLEGFPKLFAKNLESFFVEMSKELLTLKSEIALKTLLKK